MSSPVLYAHMGFLITLCTASILQFLKILNFNFLEPFDHAVATKPATMHHKVIRNKICLVKGNTLLNWEIIPKKKKKRSDTREVV